MMERTKQTDTELIRSFREGDERSFTVLTNRYYSDLFNVIFYYVRERTLAEDLVQDTLIKICLSLKSGRYCDTGKFLPWCLRIAHNLCLDHLRKGDRIYYVDCFERTSLAAQTSASPEEELIRHQKQQRLNLLVNNLSAPLREVVQYRHYEEMSFREIAERTGTGLNTTLGRMRYALMHLRKSVGKDPAFTGLSRE